MPEDVPLLGRKAGMDPRHGGTAEALRWHVTRPHSVTYVVKPDGHMPHRYNIHTEPHESVMFPQM